MHGLLRAGAIPTLGLLAAVLTATACGSDDGGAAPDADAGAGPGSSSGATSSSSGSSSSSGGATSSSSSSSGGSSGAIGDGGTDADASVVKLGASALGAGGDAACAIIAGGALHCWGDGKGEPQTVMPGSSFVDVDLGGYSTGTQACAVRSDGALFCWTASTFAPAQRDTGTFKRTSVGWSHACAIASSGKLYCWGSNYSGQLGIGSTTPSSETNLTEVGTDTDWLAVSAGADHTCAIKNGGALYCWGGNSGGQVGDNGGSSQDGGAALEAAPVAITPGTTWKDVSAGYYTTCGVESDGTLACWGSGLGRYTKVPTAIDTAKDWVSVRLGQSHACALKTTGAVYCWGDNASGQLGTGDFTARTSPAEVGIDTDWTSVAAGNAFSCATKSDGSVRCWGSDGQGELGTGDVSHLSPTKIGAGWQAVDTGSNVTCGVKTSGANLACWGAMGSLGGQNAPARQEVPTTIGADTDWLSVALGSAWACARKTGGALYCWGNDYDGVVGTGGSATYVYTPTSVSLTAAAVDLASDHSCAIGTDGAFYCWGSDTFEQSGTNGDKTTPTKVGTDTWTAVADGWYSTCAIKSDGSLWCQGFGFSGAMEEMGTDKTWTAVANFPGREQYMGIKAGALYTWSWIDALAQVGTETSWKAIAVGGSHWCGIRTDDSLACAGSNSDGQLGDGTTTARTNAVAVGTDKDWTAVAAGASHTCGIRNGGELYCWGSNTAGEIGDGTAWSTTPVAVK